MIEQSIKQFLKMDRGKVLLTLSLYVISGLIATLTRNLFILGLLCPPFFWVKAYFESRFIAFSQTPLGMVGFQDIGVIFAGLLLSIIYYYLLSCLLVFLYDRVKGRSTK